MIKLQLVTQPINQSTASKLLATPHCRWGLDTPDLTSRIKNLDRNQLEKLGHFLLSHICTSLTQQKNSIKRAIKKKKSKFLFPVFLFPLFPVFGSQTLVSHDQRHTDSWMERKKNGVIFCKTHNHNHSFNHGFSCF